MPARKLRKNKNNEYVAEGQIFKELIGSRTKVMNGTAYKTSGNLIKADLMYNTVGKIVSRKKSIRAKRENKLGKAGYKPKKGVFKLFPKKRRMASL